MNIDVPLRQLDITPSSELMNFDYAGVAWDNFVQTRYGDIHGGSFNFSLIRSDLATTAPETAVEVVNQDSPLHALAMVEIQKLEAQFNAKAMIAVFLKMKTNASNPIHQDFSPIFQVAHRCYIVIKTNDKAYLEVEGQTSQFSGGEVIEVDNTRGYRWINSSSDDEIIHLLVDLIPLPAA